MIYVKAILGLIFLSHASFASLGPQSHHGTGQAYANAPCPYNQSTLPPQVLSRSERLKNEAADMAVEIARLQDDVETISKDEPFPACKKAVNETIMKVCGANNEGLGNEAIDSAEDHMRGVALFARNANYLDSYMVVYQGIMTSKMTTDRQVASGCPCGYSDDGCLPCDTAPIDDGGWVEEPTTPRTDGPLVPNSGSCFDRYALNNGVINHRICDDANHPSGNTKTNCRPCLRPSGRYPRGLYPTKFKEYFDMQQRLAELEDSYKMAVAKAACTEKHIDNAPETGPNAESFRRCIQLAHPRATAADFCLFCDETGTTQRAKSFDLNRWGPSLVTGIGLAGLGIWANSNVRKSMDGNNDAGYPADTRAGIYTAQNFGSFAIPMMVNSLQSAGAFGCAQTAGGANGQGQVSFTNNMGNFISQLFGANAGVQVNGALGYPPGYVSGQADISGGVFNGNPHAGPWTGANISGSLQAEQAALQQAQANYAQAARESQQRIEALNALNNIQLTIDGMVKQNQNNNLQISELQRQAAALAAQTGLGAFGGGAGGQLGGQTGAGVRLGFDLSAYGGINAGGNGSIYSGGTPLTQFPPYPQQYNGPGYGIPNDSGSNYDYNSGGSSGGTSVIDGLNI